MSNNSSNSSSSVPAGPEENTVMVPAAENVVGSAAENAAAAVAPVLNQNHEVPCETMDGDIVPVHVGLLRQSKTFLTMWTDLGMDSATEQQLREFKAFPVKRISTKTFSKVIEWMREHVGQPEPIVEQDPGTGERKWFPLTEWEKNFFEIGLGELTELMNAGNFLNLPSLYLYSCQAAAALFKQNSPEELVGAFGLEDNMTAEEKTAESRKNVWCNY